MDLLEEVKAATRYNTRLVWIESPSRQPLHLAFQLDQFLLQMRCLRRQLFRWFLQVGRVELRKIASYARFQWGPASLHLPAREVLVAGIDGLKLAAVDRNARHGGLPRTVVRSRPCHAGRTPRTCARSSGSWV